MRRLIERLLLLAAVTTAGCGRTAKPETHAPLESASSTPMAPSVWPPLPPAPAGSTYVPLHAQTLQVAVAVANPSAIRTDSLPYGHSVIYVDLGAATLSITFTSGMNAFEAGLQKTPPTFIGLPVERMVRTPDNTTLLLHTRDGENVMGYTRGAECKGEQLAPSDIDAAFAICASLRTLAPGPLTEEVPPSQRPFPKVPKGAYASHEYVTEVHAGQFIGKVIEGACPTQAELEAKWTPGDLGLERRDYPHGVVLISHEAQEYEGTRYATLTEVWATRRDHCCIAMIPEFFTPPNQSQIDYVASWCDSTAD